MRKKSEIDQLGEIAIHIITWLTVLQEDYAERMSKIQGVSPEEIKKGIQDITAAASKLLTPPPKVIIPKSAKTPGVLPEKPPKTSEVQIPVLIYICRKFSISWSVTNFNIEKTQEDICKKQPAIGLAMTKYFTVQLRLQTSYEKFKNGENETIDNFFELKKEMLYAKAALEELLQQPVVKITRVKRKQK
jgi:hypothetical protein